MKSFKKLGASLLTVGLLVTPLFQANAASGINTYEQRILDELSTPVQFDGRLVPFPQENINEARNHLMSAGVDLEEEEVNQILGYMASARAKIIAGGYSQFTHISQGTFDTILNLIDRAGAVVGFRFIIDPITGEVIVLNADGDIIMEPTQEGPIRQTGLGIEATVMVAAGLVGILGASFVVAKKNDLFSMAD